MTDGETEPKKKKKSHAPKTEALTVVVNRGSKAAKSAEKPTNKSVFLKPSSLSTSTVVSGALTGKANIISNVQIQKPSVAPTATVPTTADSGATPSAAEEAAMPTPVQVAGPTVLVTPTVTQAVEPGTQAPSSEDNSFFTDDSQLGHDNQLDHSQLIYVNDDFQLQIVSL